MLAHDPLSSLGYPMITYTHPTASNLAAKTLVAKQWPTNDGIALYSHKQKSHKHTWDTRIDVLPGSYRNRYTCSTLWMHSNIMTQHGFSISDYMYTDLFKVLLCKTIGLLSQVKLISYLFLILVFVNFALGGQAHFSMNPTIKDFKLYSKRNINLIMRPRPVHNKVLYSCNATV